MTVHFEEQQKHINTLTNEKLTLQAKVEELKTDLHCCNGVADLAMKHRDIAEARVEELEAIIRDVLYGEPFDEFGNRNTNGMYRHLDHKYVIRRLEEAELKEGE